MPFIKNIIRKLSNKDKSTKTGADETKPSRPTEIGANQTKANTSDKPAVKIKKDDISDEKVSKASASHVIADAKPVAMPPKQSTPPVRADSALIKVPPKAHTNKPTSASSSRLSTPPEFEGVKTPPGMQPAFQWTDNYPTVYHTTAGDIGPPLRQYTCTVYQKSTGKTTQVLMGLHKKIKAGE